MTTRQIFTEDTVLIASPDSCKWGLVIMRSSQGRSMKQEHGMLRVTAKPERIDGAHLEGVYMRFSPYEIQTKCTIVLQKTSL